MGVYDYSVKARNGEDIALSDYRGKVIMIVNTATGCGFTPQYEPIEQMYSDLHDKGFEVIDIPCNQFGGQAPGSDDEIHEFCVTRFHTSFQQMKKSDVNGGNELPLYRYLKSQKGFEGFDEHPYKEQLEKMFSAMDPHWRANPDIKWNFTKFIIDREGNVAARFEPTADMSRVDACVKELLKQSGGKGVTDVIKARRSCRSFRPELIGKDKLDRIIEAGTYAATGMGRQSPIIISVRKKEIRDRIAALNAQIMGRDDGFDPFYGAPEMLIVLADKSVPTYICDGSLVMGNMMLAAEELGVGSCWIHRAREEFESEYGKALLAELGITGGYEGIGHLAIGYPAAPARAAAPRKDNYVYRVE